MGNIYINIIIYFINDNMENTPNILSDELDQVAKTGYRYYKELHEPELNQAILDNFADVSKENGCFIEETDSMIMAWFEKNKDKLPLLEVLCELKDISVVSCEISRKKKEKTWWFSTAIWPAISVENMGIGKVFTKNKDTANGDIITYLTFIKTKDAERPTLKITAKQIEFSGEWAMLPNYVVFKKELAGEEFEKEAIEL